MGEYGRLVYVAPQNIAKLSELTLANGNLRVARNNTRYPGGGGGGAMKIDEGAYAVLYRTRILNNEVRRDDGGAIHNQGTVHIYYSMISGNRWMQGRSSVKGYGGALYHAGDYATIYKSTIEDNTAFRGGGIYIGYSNYSGQSDRAAPRLDINDSIIQRNTADVGGGGLYDAGSNTRLTDVEIVNNRTTLVRSLGGLGGGGIYKTGDAVWYPSFAYEDSEQISADEDGFTIFNNAEASRFGCRNCHRGFGLMPNNGRYTDLGLLNKILHSMPPSDPSRCGMVCSIKVLEFLRLLPSYEVRRSPEDVPWSSGWNGPRSLRLIRVKFDGNDSAAGGDHCQTQEAAWSTRVYEEDLIPGGGYLCPL